MASLKDDVAAYESWLRKHCDVVEADLEAKHRRMRESAFDFLRATYFRWARTIASVCPELAGAPRLVCIGDIHIENFGTWRDAESRLVWGINDFDEAAAMPFAYDLVRLATSALLAPDLKLTAVDVATAILGGYHQGLTKPRPVLLDERVGWLRSFANADADSNDKFWREVDEYPKADPPAAVRRALRRSLPKGASALRFASRRKGGGSLGRPRYVAIAEWKAGHVVREAKALVPSAWEWAHGKRGRRYRFIDVAYGSFRSPDPHLRVDAGFVLRRLAPDSRKIEINDVHQQGLTPRLFAAMGAELAAVHSADSRSKRISNHLESMNPQWLHRATDAARASTEQDFESYRLLANWES